MVSELKAKLSGYLALVRGGATVTVYDRKTPIARLVPFDGNHGGLDVREPIDTAGLSTLPNVRLGKRIDVVALLRADRNQR